MTCNDGLRPDLNQEHCGVLILVLWPLHKDEAMKSNGLKKIPYEKPPANL